MQRHQDYVDSESDCLAGSGNAEAAARRHVRSFGGFADLLPPG